MNMQRDIGKWNYETHEYDPYMPNPDWKLKLYSQDMDEPINCASCGKEMTYGEGYSSEELHNHIGFGYPVCEECYRLELARQSAGTPTTHSDESEGE